ncbi:hypothetical protein HYDPIDRAFT_115551 [Hydnomerulius pinastri MD-312]|uniref:Uncharacterized protein n=1 Tax=Hydnomerulius pinastri MD-312 TaxID=994086 RepID=A0A0C9W564_9AGAM|nr:hypothetical protein HYDPIDRAFT_115551 [Hydnomerulius pinastri MD-312]
MDDRIVTVPYWDDDGDKSCGSQLFDWICYCTCIPYHPPPPRPRGQPYEVSSDESDSE